MTNARGYLRSMTTGDLEQVLAWRNHPNIQRYMYTQRTIMLEEHKAWFELACDDPNKHLLIYELDAKPTGFVNLNVVDTNSARADWGFYLAPDASRGNGQLLGNCVLSYAFTHLHLHKLCGEVLVHNQPSLKFHEKLGFSREATLREHFFDGKTYHDVIGFGLLGDEWYHQQGVLTS